MLCPSGLTYHAFGPLSSQWTNFRLAESCHGGHRNFVMQWTSVPRFMTKMDQFTASEQQMFFSWETDLLDTHVHVGCVEKEAMSNLTGTANRRRSRQWKKLKFRRNMILMIITKMWWRELWHQFYGKINCKFSLWNKREEVGNGGNENITDIHTIRRLRCAYTQIGDAHCDGHL
jgi:hypothetical protein